MKVWKDQNRSGAMNRLALIMTMFCAAAVALAQNTFFLQFDSVQDGLGGRGASLEEVDDGYLVFCEQLSVDSVPTPRGHLFIRKVDLSGQVVWSKELNASSDRDFSYSGFGARDPITRTPTGEIVSAVIGFDYDPNVSFHNDLSLYWFDTNGDTIRTKAYFSYDEVDTTRITAKQTLSIPHDSGLAICGTYRDTTMTRSEMTLMRMNSNGDTLWYHRYPNTHWPSDATVNYDGGFLMTGVNSDWQLYDANWLIRTNQQGNQLWRKWFGAYREGLPHVRLAPDSGIYTWSTHDTIWNSNGLDSVRVRLIKWDQNGVQQWHSDFMDDREPGTQDFEVLPDGGVIVTYHRLSTMNFIRFDPQGNILWNRLYTPFGSGGFVHDIEPTSDGGFIATGEGYQGGNDPTPGLQTIFLMKLDSMGCLVPGCQSVGVEEVVLGLEDALTVFPNPSNGLFTVQLKLPAELEVKGELQSVVVDALGKVVQQRTFPPLPGRGAGGEATLQLDLTEQPSGLYYLHITDGARALTGARLVKE